jgi:ribosomal 30S subunit maturation factor RimM
MVVATTQDLVGLAAFSRDETKLGKIKGVVRDESGYEYLVVGRLLHSLIIPVEAIETPGDHVVVPFTSSYIDMSPAVKAKDTVSVEERSRLRDFYHVHQTA